MGFVDKAASRMQGQLSFLEVGRGGQRFSVGFKNINFFCLGLPGGGHTWVLACHKPKTVRQLCAASEKLWYLSIVSFVPKIQMKK